MVHLLEKIGVWGIILLTLAGSVWGEFGPLDRVLPVPPTPFESVNYTPGWSSKEAGFSEDLLKFHSSLFWSGMVDVVARDTLAYCAMYNGLMILDISDPTAPKFVSQLYMPDGYATDIRVDGEYAYLTEWGNAFYIADISDPTDPFMAGKYLLQVSAYGLDVADTLAFVAYGLSSDKIGFLILDISDPGNITVVADVSADEFSIQAMFKVDVDGNYAYVVGDGYVWILDISDPAYPVTQCRFLTGYSPNDLVVKDTLVFLADLDRMWPAGISAFTILDVSDRTQPEIIGRKRLRGSVTGVALKDNLAFMANGEQGVQIFDISNPAAPDSLGVIPVPEFAGKVAVADTVLLIVDYGPQPVKSQTAKMNGPSANDLLLAGITEVSNPQILGFYGLPGPITSVISSGDYVYALNSSDFRADILMAQKTGDRFDSVGHYYTPGTAQKGLVYNDTLYLAAGSEGLEVIDISDPANLYRVRHYSAPSGLDVAIKDGYAYLAAASSGVRIFDITKPDDIPVATINTPGLATCVRINENLLYIAVVFADGIQIYDISNPEGPVYITSFGDEVCQELEISNSVLFSSSSLTGIDAFDITTDSLAPVLLKKYIPISNPLEIAVSDNLLITALGYSGIEVVDITNPREMYRRFIYNTPFWAEGLSCEGDYVYVADEGGLIILKKDVITDLNDGNEVIPPTEFTLRQNHPNPFNPVTTIEFDLSRYGYSTLKIYNLLGREVTTLVNKALPAGSHAVRWDGRDSEGNSVSSGIYFYRLTSGAYSASKKMILVK